MSIRRSVRLALGALVIVSATSAPAATTHVYPAPGSLQAAIDAASAGDSLVLHGGTYDGPILVDKPLTFRHLRFDLFDPVIIDAGCAAPVAFDIQASNVAVKGVSAFDRRFIVNNGTTTNIRVQNADHVQLMNTGSATDLLTTCGGGTALEIANSTRVTVKAIGVGFCGDLSPDVGIDIHDIDVLPKPARMKIKQFSICANPTGTGVLVQNVAAGSPLGKSGIALTEGFAGNPGVFLGGPGAYGARLIAADGLLLSKNQLTGSTDALLVDGSSDNSSFRSNDFIGDAVDNGQGNCWKNNMGSGAVPTSCP